MFFKNIPMFLKKYSNIFQEYSNFFRYFGHHSLKQFIRGKPTRFGFKVWCCNCSIGFTRWVEPYCGKSTQIPDRGLGQGPNVVLGLINEDHGNLPQGSDVSFDNLFTSLDLLDEMSKRGIAGSGTMRH